MSNSKNTSFDLVKLVKSTPEVLKKAIKDVDLRTIDKKTIDNVIKAFLTDHRIDSILDKIYILVANPKGGIDVNSSFEGRYIITFFIYSKNAELFRRLADRYIPNINVKTKSGNTLLAETIAYENIEPAKVLVEHGADVDEKVDGYGYMRQLYGLELVNSRPFYNLFLKHGIDIDQIIDRESEYNSLMSSISEGDKEKFDFYIDNGADVNQEARNEYTPLCIAAYSDKSTYYLKRLIEKDANVNYISPGVFIKPDDITIENASILQQCVYEKRSIDNIKILLESGANKDHKETTTNKTVLEIAKDRYNTDKKYYEKVIELLNGEVPKKGLWKGFSRSDIEKFDIFFEKPFDWSCCPICLEYVERSDGCMYMAHNCATTGHYYHEKLYNKFSYTYGQTKVEWCTICGRITENHKHFKLTDANNPSKEKAPLKPEIQAQLNRGDNVAFFDNANCMGFGGGGTEEKAARFRRLREYALDLQEDVDKKQLDEAMEELIEEVWNAPLIRNKKIKKILADKRWNINVNEFPENKKNTRNNNNSNTVNVPFGGRNPTKKDGEDCIIFGDDEEGEASNPVYQFHHETVGGMNHDGIYICQKDLSKAVEIKCKEFGLEDFGKCWFSQCKGILHPEELKDIIPEVLYNEYRKKFNNKMTKKGGRRTTRKIKKQRGGNVESSSARKSILHELKDGTCTPHKTKN